MPDMPDIEAIVSNHTEAPEPASQSAQPMPPDQSSEDPPVEAAPEPQEAPEPPAETLEPAPEPEPEPQQDDNFQRLQSIMEAEREHRQRETQLQQRQQQLQEQEQRLSSLRQYEQLAQAARSQDLGAVLRSLNINPQEAQQALAEGRAVDPLAPVREEFTSKLTEQQKQVEQQLKQLQQYQLQETQRRAHTEAREQIESASPLLAASGDVGLEAVIGGFQSHYNETGAVPSYESVIKKAEADLVKFLEPFFKNEQIRQRFLPQGPGETKPSVTKKTLTNQDAAAVTSRQPEEDLTNLQGEALIDALIQRHQS